MHLDDVDSRGAKICKLEREKKRRWRKKEETEKKSRTKKRQEEGGRDRETAGEKDGR